MTMKAKRDRIMSNTELDKRFQIVIKELDSIRLQREAAGETERTEKERQLLDELDQLEFQLHQQQQA